MMKQTRGCGMMGALRHRAGWMAVLLLIVSAPLMTSCYGKFPLTRAVYDFNGQVTEHKLVHSVVMWAFVWIPVYGVAALGDVVIFNLIEFWTGEEMKVGATKAVDGSEVTIRPGESSEVAYMTLRRDGQLISEEKLVRVSDTVLNVYGQDGQLKGQMIRDEAGRVQLVGTDGAKLASFMVK